MSLALRRLRGERFFYLNPFSAHRLAFKNGYNTVRVFYAVSCAFAIKDAQWAWSRLYEAFFTAPLWPIAWISKNYYHSLIHSSFLLWLFGSLAALWRPDRFYFRITQCLGFSLYVVLYNSQGSIGNNFHAMIWVSIIFSFLPNVKAQKLSRIKRHQYLLHFWTAQFVICIFYTMSGIWKILDMVGCALDTNLSCEFSEKILTNLAAKEFIQFNRFAPLSWVLFRYPWIGFFGYFGVIWFELSAVFFAFRLNLHKYWAIILLFFHFSAYLFLSVGFSSMALATNILFLFSPFISMKQDLIQKPHWKQIPPFFRN